MSELYARESQPETLLYDIGTCVSLIGVLLAKLGGRAEISQEELDVVASKILYESYDPVKGTLTLGLADPPKLAS